jgi:hypothetical protein
VTVSYFETILHFFWAQADLVFNFCAFYHLKMPVRSPTLNASVVHEPMNQDLAKNAVSTLSEKEETNENVSKEKLTNMKLMMKTFVMGALREKEQVNYSISCT